MTKTTYQKRVMRLVGVALGVLASGQIVEADFTLSMATKVPNVNSSYGDDPPDISADGLELYFSSDRPHGTNVCYDDIWVAKRATKNDPWGEPVNLGPPVNTSVNESQCCISSDGLELYFSDGFPPWYAEALCRPGGHGNGDLWVSTRDTRQDTWGVPVNLGPVVNSSSWEDCPSISPDGLSLFFCSDRPGGYWKSHLYVATRQTKAAPWGPPVNLGPLVNARKWQARAEISPDGLLLFFSAGTTQIDIFLSRRATTADPWGPPVSLGAAVNTAKDDYGPTFSADCSTLYFNRGELAHVEPSPASLATYDIWQTEVVPIVDFNGDDLVDCLDVCDMIDHWGTDTSLYDIGPTPFGDGVVDAQDLIVLAGYLGRDLRLVAHWALDESDGLAATDDIGDRDGILYGDPTWQPDGGMTDGALELDGVDDYANMPFVLNPADGPFSIHVWVKGGAPGQVVISQTNGSAWLLADPAEGRLMTGLSMPSEGRLESKPLVSTSIITDGAWHRIGFLWDGSERVLYVDDLEVARDAQKSHLAGSDGSLSIGVDTSLKSGTFWCGLIDDVRIYNCAVKP